MKGIIKIITNTSFILLLTLLPFFNVQAQVVDNSVVNKNDSIYRYNALENKMSFSDLVGTINTKNLPEKLLENNKIPDEVATKLQDIIQKQNFSTEQIGNAMNTIENGNGLKTFLIGNNLGVIKFQLVQIKDQASLLDALILKTNDSTNKIQINNQIQLLKEERKRVENFLLEQKDKFSLFGWFVTSL